MLESEFGVGDQLPNAAAIEDTKHLLKRIAEVLEWLILDYGRG
jgi:hypothetical protein